MKHHPTDWDTKEQDRIRQPFKAPSQETHLTLTIQEELAKLSSVISE
jgi:hypothetical protein